MKQFGSILLALLAGLLPVLPLNAFVLHSPHTVTRPPDSGPATVAFGLAALLSSITNENGECVSRLVRDIPARTATETDITGGQTVARSDTAGRVTPVSRPDGVLVSNVLDVLGHPVSVRHNNSEVLGLDWRADGLLLSASNAAARIAWTHNAFGLATSETVSVPVGAGVPPAVFSTVSSTLNAAALPTNTTLDVGGSAFSVKRSYDPAERLTNQLSNFSTLELPDFSFSYSPQDGGISSVSNAVLTEVQSRDLLGHVTNITYRARVGGAILASFAYRRDVTGLVAQKVSKVGQASPLAADTYAYDALDRLTAAGSETYTYDLAGNRLSRSGTGVPPELSFYTHNRQDSVLHDHSGNVTNYTRNGIAYNLAWNTQGQLLSVATNSILAESYTYGPLGRRLSTTDSSGTVYHVYDGDHCAADVSPSGNPLRIYTWGAGIDNLLAVTVFSPSSTNTYYAVKDHLGSVHALIDASGTVAASYAYDAWGNVLSSTINYSLLTVNSLRYLWQGREYSHAAGLYNFRARWYNPEWGRWLSPDPVGLEGGLNLYEFCRNDPVNCVDPYGLWGIQFGSVNIGYGDPQMSFDNSSWGDLRRGAAATADGVLSAETMSGLFGLFDPNLFSDYYNPCDQDTKISHGMARASFVALSIAFALPQGLTRGATQTVTHWEPQGMTGLRSGDWVMTGGANARNFIMAGAKDSWEKAITVPVPKSTLHFPSGAEAWKGFIGQRIYRP
jgi:RHS repeat-associated protein